MSRAQRSAARKHRRRNTIARWAYWFVVLAVMGAAVAGVHGRILRSQRTTHPSFAPHSATENFDTDFSPSSDSARGPSLSQSPLYPYSIIPGGVHSARELKTALVNDPVAALHYSDFNVSRARVVRLDHDREMYVSYRLNDRTYWTHKKLIIPKGEAVITDGTHEARTRCGNRLSETPGPVSEEEPALEAMAQPFQPVPYTVDPADPGVVPTALYPPPFDPGIRLVLGPKASLPPVVAIPPAGGGGSWRPPQPPVSTPEPDEIFLLAIGLSSVFACVRLLRRRHA